MPGRVHRQRSVGQNAAMPRPRPLLTVLELQQLLRGGDPPTLLDVRWRLGHDDGRDEHAAGHVPGAVYVSLPEVLAGRPADPVDSSGRHPLPDPAALGAALRAAGVSLGRTVVVYDAVGGTSAARAWWLLRWAGHEDVRVLDGGWPAWRRAGGPVETGPVHPVPGDFEPAPGGMPVIDAVEAADVARGGVLVDARAAERYRGESEPVDPVAGHVPGAVNVPTAASLDAGGPADGSFRTPEQLRAVYAEAVRAAELGRPVAAYCGSGVTAAHTVMALELIGVPAALYAGSWSGWVSDPGRPVETGDRGR
jgi:thiosulfate/3-mercaptopyruvate sulfurtransferase